MYVSNLHAHSRTHKTSHLALFFVHIYMLRQTVGSNRQLYFFFSAIHFWKTKGTQTYIFSHYFFFSSSLPIYDISYIHTGKIGGSINFFLDSILFSLCTRTAARTYNLWIGTSTVGNKYTQDARWTCIITKSTYFLWHCSNKVVCT